MKTNSVVHMILAYKAYVRSVFEYGTTVPNVNVKPRLELVRNSFRRNSG